jgi:OFA family oxalate/formate antiporter-like MFS transporter
MRNISKIHGLSLTAWAVAGLTGNQMSSAIHEYSGSYTAVLYWLIPQFALALAIACFVLHKKKTSPSPKAA